MLAFKHDCIPLGISDVLGNFICLIHILLEDLRRQLLFKPKSSNVHVSWLELIFLFSLCFHELNLLKYENRGEKLHMSNTMHHCSPLSTQSYFSHHASMLFKLNVKFCTCTSRDFIMECKILLYLIWIEFILVPTTDKTIIWLILYFNTE